MTHDPGALRPIVDGAAQLNAWAGELTGLAFADERGWLDADESARFRELDASYPRVSAELAARFRELPDDALARHDAHVHATLTRMRAAGGTLGNFHIETLEPRALATAAPRREFDAWAIWAIYQVP
jgi:hypothetical protein